MKFRINKAGEPYNTHSIYEIEGENFLDALKNNFNYVLKNSCNYYVPFRFPMTGKIYYNEGVLGGKGGIVVKLSWMYSDHLLKPAKLKTFEVWIHAKKSDLEKETSFECNENEVFTYKEA